MKSVPGSSSGISAHLVRGVDFELIKKTTNNKPWKALCTVSYKVKMISSLSLRAAWKAIFSFSLAVSSGSLNCGTKLYKLYALFDHPVYPLTSPLTILKTTNSLPTSSNTALTRSGFFAVPFIRLGSFEYVSHACDNLLWSSEAGMGAGFDRSGGYADSIELRGPRRDWWISIFAPTLRKKKRCRGIGMYFEYRF